LLGLGQSFLKSFFGSLVFLVYELLFIWCQLKLGCNLLEGRIKLSHELAWELDLSVELQMNFIIFRQLSV
jgi:hypothetical protein